MIQIVIIGSGNVAQHLITAFAKSNEIDIIQLFSRQKENDIFLLDSSKITTTFNDLVEADLLIILTTSPCSRSLILPGNTVCR